jgi:hypothetical protein
VRNRDFDLFKVKGEENPGDLFTKAGLAESRITALLELLNCEYREGRPSSAPALRQEGGTKSFVLSKGERQSGGFKQRKRRAQEEYRTSATPTSKLVRAVPRPTTVTSKLTGAPLQSAPPSEVSNQVQSGGGKRWADEPEEDGEYSEEQVQQLLRRVLRMPHLVVDARASEPLVPAHPEVEELEDEMTAEGLDIGRAQAGRRGLPCRLQVPSRSSGTLGEEGRRSSRAGRSPGAATK